MDSKEQALEKAFGFIATMLLCGEECEIQDTGKAYEVNFHCNQKLQSFPYAPPVEIPAKGVIVECELPTDKAWRTAYSTGKIDHEGCLIVCWTTRDFDTNDTGVYRNWRVVEGQGEMVDTCSFWGGRVSRMQNVCFACFHREKPVTGEPCKSCQTTIPTNYKAKG